MRHQGRILLIAQCQICRTHPYTLIANGVVQTFILFQVIIRLPIVAGFFVKLLQILVTDMYHIRIYFRRSLTHRQQSPCLRKVLALQRQFYLLSINIIKSSSRTEFFKERLA